MPSSITEDRPIRWGILGAGFIAGQVGNDINLTPGNVIAAVAARDAARAADFAAKYSAARSHASYEALVNDEAVDVVYIATTHPSHREYALMAIGAGKAVLIEKPVCLNAADAGEVLGAAVEADVFSMEAMWMRTNPLIRRAQELIAQGAIGEVVGVRAEFGLGLGFDPGHRLYELANGGGALLDLGVYPATFAHLFLGQPSAISTVGELAPTGSDDTVALTWLYDGVPRAQLWCSASTPAPNEAVVFGTTGWLAFDAPMFRPSGLRVSSRGREYRIEDPIAGQGNGYGPEVAEVERCLRAGLTESPLVPHADSLAILGLLDEARARLGVRYPGE